MVRAKCQYADSKSSASYLYALKFFSSYLLECHVIYFLLKNFKSVLQVEVVLYAEIEVTMIRSLKSTDNMCEIFIFGFYYQEEKSIL